MQFLSAEMIAMLIVFHCAKNCDFDRVVAEGLRQRTSDSRKRYLAFETPEFSSSFPLFISELPPRSFILFIIYSYRPYAHADGQLQVKEHLLH